VRLQVLLDESRAEVDVELNERFVADALEAVHLAGLDDEHVAGARLELLSVHRPASATGLDELDLVVWMAVRAGPLAGEAVEEEDRDGDVTVLGADELARAADVGKIVLTDAVHGVRRWRSTEPWDLGGRADDAVAKR
jgi:hypothetical protein